MRSTVLSLFRVIVYIFTMHDTTDEVVYLDLVYSMVLLPALPRMMRMLVATITISLSRTQT